MALQRVRYPTIARRIRRMGIPKERIARELGITSKSLSDKLGGTTEFTLTESLLLARFFGMSVEELAGGDGSAALGEEMIG